MDTKSFIEKYANHPNYKSPTGNTLHAKSWQTEAPLRMFLNNLDNEVAEDPSNLVVYGGSGQAARNRDSVEKIIDVLLKGGTYTYKGLTLNIVKPTKRARTLNGTSAVSYTHLTLPTIYSV